MKLKEEEEEKTAKTGVEYLIPRKLVLTFSSNEESNETIPFPSQPQLAMYDALDRWVKNLGTTLAPWIVTASLVSSSGDPNAILLGNVSVPFVNGTANFTNLAISHNGTGYRIKYKITYPKNVSFSTIHGSHTIKEREFRYDFFSNISTVYAGADITNKPSISIYDKALGNIIETGWKNRIWYLVTDLLPSINGNATLLGSRIATISNGTGNMSNIIINKPGNDYQLKLMVYTDPPSRYKAEYITPKFDVLKQMFKLVFSQEISDCNETVICGRQPIVHVRSIMSDMLAGNIGWDGSVWHLKAFLCSNNISSQLLGTTYVPVPRSGEVIFSDLRFDRISTNETLCVNVSITPSDKEYASLTIMSSSFEVKERQMVLAVEIPPDDANETVVFGQQPVIDVRDVGTMRSAFQLRRSWSVTVSLNKTFNGGILSGNTTVLVSGTHANFSDLAISSYGVGFLLKFESNFGHVTFSPPFNVQFTNNFYPVFNSSLSKTVSFSEATKVSTSISNITAKDGDVGSAGMVRYSISSFNDTFNISASTGEIVLVKALDREVVDSYILTIRATDQAPHPFELSNTYILMVAVLDENDNKPMFRLDTKEYFVDETAEVGSVLFSLNASDADIGVNGQLVFSMVSPNDTNIFDLITSNGSFIANSTLDLDLNEDGEPSFLFNVSVRDNGVAVQYASSVMIGVTIKRVNEYAPSFVTPGISLRVKENVRIGTFLHQVSATDKDSGLDGKVTYSIIAGNNHEMFSINEDGNITTTALLDRELTLGYTLTISASDSSTTNRKSSTISVSIALEDVNDNAPVISSTTCPKYISDDSPAYGNVLTFSATDADVSSNAELEYSLVTNDPYFNESFSFSKLTKSIRTIKTLNLGKENVTVKVVNFTIIVRDKGIPSLNTSLDCSILITGENKYAPVIAHHSILNIKVPVHASSGHHVIKVNATDDDSGPDGELEFSITDGNLGNAFRISDKGEVILLKTLEYGCYILTVNISDKASASKKKYTTCTLAVYYEQKTCVTGKIFIGAVPEDTVLMGIRNTTLIVPVYASVGSVDLEGLDITLNCQSNLTLIGSKSDYFISHSLNEVRIVGLVSHNKFQFGIIKVATLTFTALNDGVVNITVSNAHIVNQRGEDVSLKKLPSQSCSNQLFGDVIADCRLNIADAAFCQSYNRQRKTNFISSYAAKFKNLAEQQKINMDANLNGDVEDKDCAYIFDVFLSKSVGIKHISIQRPNEQSKLCQFRLTASMNVAASTLPSLEVFAAITYKDSSSNDNPLSGAKISSFAVSSYPKKYGDIVKLTRSSETFSFDSDVRRTTTELGVTLIVVSNVEGSYNVHEMFRKNSQPIQSNSVNLPNGHLMLSNNFEPQNIAVLPLTTYYCKNTRVTVQIVFRFNVDYNTIIKGNETHFKKEFSTFYVNYELTNYNRTVEITSISVSSGSVVVDMKILMLSAEVSQMKDDLSAAIRNNSFQFKYQSSILSPEKTLVFIEKEQSSKPVEKDDNTTVIVVVVVVVVVLIIAVVVSLYCLKLKRRRVIASKVSVTSKPSNVKTPEKLKQVCNSKDDTVNIEMNEITVPKAEVTPTIDIEDENVDDRKSSDSSSSSSSSSSSASIIASVDISSSKVSLVQENEGGNESVEMKQIHTPNLADLGLRGGLGSTHSLPAEKPSDGFLLPGQVSNKEKFESNLQKLIPRDGNRPYTSYGKKEVDTVLVLSADRPSAAQATVEFPNYIPPADHSVLNLDKFQSTGPTISSREGNRPFTSHCREKVEFDSSSNSNRASSSHPTVEGLEVFKETNQHSDSMILIEEERNDSLVLVDLVDFTEEEISDDHVEYVRNADLINDIYYEQTSPDHKPLQPVLPKQSSIIDDTGDGRSMFCQCGRIAIIECEKCKSHGYCSNNCKQTGEENNFCRKSKKEPKTVKW